LTKKNGKQTKVSLSSPKEITPEEQPHHLDTYAKIVALSAIKAKSELEKSIWILDTAKFTQNQICKILHVSDHTVRAVLEGKGLKKGEKEVEQ
jgi:hypothetical protein